jgi:hypothetical protein
MSIRKHDLPIRINDYQNTLTRWQMTNLMDSSDRQSSRFETNPPFND